MSEFETQYKLLNAAQKEAVDSIDGPVLVIAGPGTGKTQLLSMRVANILQKSDASPNNILCLTFTNKAATNMRERLFKLAGPLSNGVLVKTFHSFAAEIMSLYPDYFWSGAKLSTAPDTTQLEIIQTILSELPLDNPLASKFAGKYTAVDDVSRALKLVKEAGLSPEKLEAIIKFNLAYIDEIEEELVSILDPVVSAKKLDALKDRIQALPDHKIDALVTPLLSLSTVIKESLETAIAEDEGSGKTKNIGKWKSRWVQTVDKKKGMHSERKRNEWWLALADVYADYRAVLHERGYYDYADMLVEVLTQLEQNPNLLSEVQEQFSYVLIDEFQDSNGAQLRLSHLVASHHSSEGRPNLMAVGDDDQSIFGFNGAEQSNMLFFDRNYKATKKIVLRDNYRSSQAVLDTSAQIIANATDRLANRDKAFEKNLVAVNPPKEAGVIEHHRYKTREHQLSEIARLIKSSKKSNIQTAVLARSHDSLRQLSSILLNIGVPVRYEQQSNILEHEAVQQVIHLSEIVVALSSGDEEKVNKSLSDTLRHPMWGIAPETLWQIAVDNYNNPKWLKTLLENNDPKVANIAHWLLWLEREASYQPLPLFLEYLIGLRDSEHINSPIRDYFAGRRDVDNDYLHALSAIRLLRELVNEFAAAGTPSLTDFVNFIRVNIANDRGVTDESPFVSDENAVELYTVHKAKGLEFDCVYIIDAIEDNWKPRVGGRKPPANLPLQPPGEEPSDYARLMYVAATRARHTLIVSCFGLDHAGKDLLPTPLISHIKEVAQDDSKEIPPVVVLEEALRWPELAHAKQKELLKGRMQSFSINVTNLLNFLDISSGGPEYFFERNILRLPEAKTPTLAHGTATHAALEYAQKLTNTDEFEIGNVLTEYETALKREHLPPLEYERYLKHGQTKLKELFEKKDYQLPKGSISEQRITGISVGKAIIGGKLDRVDRTNDKLIIVDYKTGQGLASFETNDKAKAIKAWKHKTQLIFYALLARNYPTLSKYKNIEGQMVYVEADSARDLVRSYIPTDAEIDRLEKLINAVWPKMTNLDLPDIKKYTADISGILEFEEGLLKQADG